MDIEARQMHRRAVAVAAARRSSPGSASTPRRARSDVLHRPASLGAACRPTPLSTAAASTGRAPRRAQFGGRGARNDGAVSTRIADATLAQRSAAVGLTRVAASRSAPAAAAAPALRPTAEEQRLTDRRAHRVRLERLGDEICRLRPLAGQQTLRKRGDEDHRHVDRRQDFVHRVEPDCRRRVGCRPAPTPAAARTLRSLRRACGRCRSPRGRAPAPSLRCRRRSSVRPR